MTRASGNLQQNVPYNITTDVSCLPPGDRAAIPHILNALNLSDVIFRKMTKQPTLEGPFVFDRDLGREYYPEGPLDDFTAYLASCGSAERERLLEPRSAVVREPNGAFSVLPYSRLYDPACPMIARHLRDAASTVSDPAFAHFLKMSARGFVSDDHIAADKAWLRVGKNLGSTTLELNFGFQEYDLDDVCGVKCDIQGVFGIVNRAETEKFRTAQRRMLEFDAFLGMRYGYQPNPSDVTMVAINQLESSGTAAFHFVPAAFILPNDPKFRRAHGAKQVFCLDTMRARLELVTRPIGLRVLPKEYQTALTMTMLKLFVREHEGGHGTSFQFRGEEFGKFAHSFEEGRADVVGLYDLLKNATTSGAGKLAKLAVILAAADGLRRLRLGINESHSVGQTLQYNWLLEKKALSFTHDGMTFAPELFAEAIESLCDALYAVWASKDQEKAHAFAKRWGTPPDELMKLEGRFGDLPKDLDPVFNIKGLAA